MRLLLALLAGSAVAGCLGPEGSPARATERLPEWRLDEEWEAGAEGSGGPSFSLVTGIVAGGDGRVFVADRREGAIQVLDSRGRLAGRWGRAGEGPGEFRHLAYLALHGDTLHAVDPTLQRVTAFDGAGRVLATTPVSAEVGEPGFAPARPIGRFRDGTVLAGSAVLPSPSSERQAARVPLVRIAPGGAAARVGRVSHRGGSVEIPLGRGASLSMLHPVRYDDLLAVEPDGRAFVVLRRAPASAGEAPRFTLLRLSPAGDTLGAWSFAYEPVPVSRAAVDSLVRTALRGRTLPGPGAVERALALPAHEPPVSAMVAGRDGTVWLRREALGRDAVVWEVVGREGKRVARLRVPAAVRLLAADSAHAYAVVPGDDDVPLVVRYRIRRLPAAPR